MPLSRRQRHFDTNCLTLSIAFTVQPEWTDAMVIRTPGDGPGSASHHDRRRRPPRRRVDQDGVARAQRPPHVTEDIIRRVREAAAAVNYHPTCSPAQWYQRRSHLIGLVYENPSPSYVVDLQKGVLDGCATTITGSSSSRSRRFRSMSGRHRPVALGSARRRGARAARVDSARSWPI